MTPKIYEIPTEDLNSNRFIPNGKTTVKVILLEEHKKDLKKQSKEILDYYEDLIHIKPFVIMSKEDWKKFDRLESKIKKKYR